MTERYRPVFLQTQSVVDQGEVSVYPIIVTRGRSTFENIAINVGDTKLRFSVLDIEDAADDLTDIVHNLVDGNNIQIICGERSAVVAKADAKRIADVLLNVPESA